MMIPRSFIAAVFLATITTAAVVDVEPPVFTFCPSDILFDNLTESEVRVDWQQPRASDNSGDLPALWSNRQSGDLFSVPGEHQVVYTAVDGSANVDSSCTFQITLKLKSCIAYPAPQNGALACVDMSGEVCAVTCKREFDFAFVPAWLYLCASGSWLSFPPFGPAPPAPWPDCSVQANPSSLKMNLSPFYYFDGDANQDPNVIEGIKNNFHDFLASPFFPGLFCENDPQQCSKEKVNVSVGTVTDVEPPVFTFCPSDILFDNLTESEMRVAWQHPIASDNSGDLPALSSNRQSGDLFSVPGEYQVVYTAVDGSHNVDSSCTFKITLKLKSCAMYPAPQNGAFACLDTSDGGKLCAVTCKYGFDFAFRPPLLYLCSLGKWDIFDIQPNTNPLPWPDCSVQKPPGSPLEMNVSPFYYFDGDENDPNVIIEVIKDNFHNLLESTFPFFCGNDQQQCSEEKVNVTLAK